MENPLEQPVPDDIMARVHAYARDLAWGVVNGWWSAELGENDTSNIGRSRVTPMIYYQGAPVWIADKWKKQVVPSINILSVFGYIARVEDGYFTLTRDAFALLNRPAASPSIFISYRRGESTTFALYLESRLRLAGNHDVFVDKALEPGSQWRDVLTEKIQQSKYMIVLIAPSTLESEWVRREIDLAQAAECAIIPVLHHDMHNRDLPENLGAYQTIKVQDKTAAEYETAVNKLLSFMGYSTF